MHTHSHGDAIGDPGHDLTVLGEAQAVLRDVLELMESDDRRHYEAMVEVVAENRGQEEV